MIVVVAMLAAAGSAEESRTELRRPYTLGAVGDHDGDGTPDYAVAGNPTASERLPTVVRVYSGADDHLIAELPTPVLPLCRFVVHDAHVTALADLDGDGVAELGAWDDRAWLLEGRTGAVVREFRAGDAALAAVGDLDGDRVPELLIGKGAATCHRSDPVGWEIWSGHSLTAIRGWQPTDVPTKLRIDVACHAWTAFIEDRSACSGQLVSVRTTDKLVDDDGSVEPFPTLEVREASSGALRCEFDFGFVLADDEWGGCGDFRVHSPGDLDRDGTSDVVVAMPAWLFGPKRSFVGAISTATGTTLWRSRSLEIESTNPSVDGLPDRDHDGVDELLVSSAGGGGATFVAIVSGKTGEVLAKFRP